MNKLIKKDIVLSLVIGEVCAWLMFLIGRNLAQENPAIESFVVYLKYLIIGFPIICAFGLVIAYFLSKVVPVIYQIAKFILVGGLNFLIDMGVLNFLVFYTGISAGLVQTGFKAISFLVAVINSYFWNKKWTFERKSDESTIKEFFQFATISLIGFFINIAVNYVLVNMVEPWGGMQVKSWAQLSAMLSAIVGLVWNFFGYKFIVFEK